MKLYSTIVAILISLFVLCGVTSCAGNDDFGAGDIDGTTWTSDQGGVETTLSFDDGTFEASQTSNDGGKEQSSGTYSCIMSTVSFIATSGDLFNMQSGVIIGSQMIIDDLTLTKQ